MTIRRLFFFALFLSFTTARAQVVDGDTKPGVRRMRAGPLRGMSLQGGPAKTILNYDTSSVLVRSTQSPSLSVSGMKLTRSAIAPKALAQRTSDFTRYNLEPGVDPRAAVAAIVAEGRTAQLNFIYSTNKAPEAEPQYGQQWGLKNIGQQIVRVPGGSNVSTAANTPPLTANQGWDIGAEQAWDTITDCSSVVVAVIDSGVRSTHQELVGNMWDDGNGHHGFSFVHDDFNAEDELGHGTHVAATIGAAADNGFGGSGVCWKARIMSVQVIDHHDRGFTSDIIAGIRWAVDHGAKVINMSLGGVGSDPALRDAVAYAEANDVVVVVSAGNSSADNDTVSTIPANYVTDSGLAVLAIRQDGQAASFTNFGKTKVHLGAPGNNIYSAIGAEGDSSRLDTTSGWNFVTNPTAPGETFNANWGWGVLTNQGTTQDGFFANIKNFYDEGAPTYRPNSKDYMYKSADLRPTNGWLPAETVTYLSYFGEVDMHTSDQIALRCSPNPVVAPAPSDCLPASDGGLSLGGVTGNSQGSPTLRDFPVPDACRVETATVGFALISDATNQRRGGVLYGSDVAHIHALNTTYDVYRGTSMAAPHVAGVAALLRAHRPYASARRVVADILASVRPVDSLKTKTVSGGILNAAAALSIVAPPTNLTAEIITP